MRSFALRDGFWRTGDEDSPPPLPPSGPRSTIQSAVLIRRDCAQSPQWCCPDRAVYAVVEQLLNIGEVQTGGRLIKNNSVCPVPRFDSSRASFTRWAHHQKVWLRTAPGECTSDQRPQRLQLTRQSWHRIKELTRLSMVISSTSWMVLPLYLISSVRGYSVYLCTGRTARRYPAGRHLHFDHAIALTGFAAPATDVKLKRPGV